MTKQSDTYHVPVLLKEVIKLLNVKPGERYVDTTIGGGGHSQEIIRLGGEVLGIDQDEDAINETRKKVENIILYKGNFAHLKQVAETTGFGKVDGILFDLGISTHQLEAKNRGFSFNSDDPLDMRMDKNLAVSARDLINGLNEGELSELIQKLGEDKFAKRIAREIIRERKIKPIETCGELADVIRRASPRTTREKIHPATRTFQALRIAVNDELNSLKETLPQALDILKPNGRLVVISFHSLEDRIVKNFFKEKESTGEIGILTEKPITPTAEEINNNPKSRSAKLRAARKNGKV